MQKDRKKEHKQVVKYIRRINKQLSQDEYLGINRFRIDIWSENWHRFSDGSGGELFLVFKIIDTLIGNFAMFTANNYSYAYKVGVYINDFLIRCSSGHPGHYPFLQYIVYDVSKIISYDGCDVENKKIEEGIINKYNWIER